jgi:hypothetical protein
MTAYTPVSIDTDPVAAIAALMPWTGEEERWLRSRLLIAQQVGCTRALGAQSVTARGLFWLINETAAANVTAPATADELRELRQGLVFLITAANMFERREGGNDS